MALRAVPVDSRELECELEPGSARPPWELPNWSDPAPDWATYQEAFSWEGERHGAESCLHHLLHEKVFSFLPRCGHAFGMALARSMDISTPSLEEGTGIPGLKAVVGRLNARQMGRMFVDWLHEARTGGPGGRPSAAGLLRALPPKGPVQVVSLTAPTSLSSGHALVAYAVERLDDGRWAVRVFDPNAPSADHACGSDAPGWLYVDGQRGRWRYRMADAARWEGDLDSGGLLLVPEEILRAEAIPFTRGRASARGPRTLVMVEGDARSAGLTDHAGRSFFVPDAPMGFEPDDPGYLAAPEVRPAVSRWTWFGGLRAAARLPETYLAGLRRGERLAHTLRGVREGGYTYTVLQREGAVTLRGASSEGTTRLVLEGTPGLPRVHIQTDRRQIFHLDFVVLLQGPARRLAFRLANLALRPADKLTAALGPQGRYLLVENGGSGIAFDMSIEVRGNGYVTQRSFARYPLLAEEQVSFVASEGDPQETATVSVLMTPSAHRSAQGGGNGGALYPAATSRNSSAPRIWPPSTEAIAR